MPDVEIPDGWVLTGNVYTEVEGVIYLCQSFENPDTKEVQTQFTKEF